MRKSLFLLVLLSLLSLLVFIWWKGVSMPVNPKDVLGHDFLITKGQSLTSIAKALEKEGFIKSEIAFRAYTQATGKGKVIQAGKYTLSPNLNLQQIVFTLDKGPSQVWITFPEGLRREEMIGKATTSLQIKDADKQVFAKEFLEATRGQEGFLFPDTYLFPKDTTAVKIADKLRQTFDTKVTEQMRADMKKNELNLEQTIILASIIERETNTDQERPIVAGILLKRLDAGWPLQADATLQYANGCEIISKPGQIIFNCEWWEVPTLQDRQSPSEFNTYLNHGLPPSPIANPGLSAIKASIYPEETLYWFYLHGKDGKIRYAKTDDEHADNIQKYL